MCSSDRPSATVILRKPLLQTTIRKFMAEFPVSYELIHSFIRQMQ